MGPRMAGLPARRGEAMEDRPITFKPVPGNVMPRFSGIPTFMRLPHVGDPAGVDIGLIAGNEAMISY